MRRPWPIEATPRGSDLGDDCAATQAAPHAPLAFRTVNPELAIAPPPSPLVAYLRQVDPLAMASAVCGLTAFVPILSQLAGLVLGVAGLVRIRCARRRGLRRLGIGWAVTGLISSGAALAVWALLAAAFLAASLPFRDVGTALSR
ncbi:MAG: hypothetical protein LC135_07145 [Phycisphaerae bacterium]|nr:hypothetical protein [Phycisphaerae bacterium]MCZ2399630.1 hypothetical protein [Phycisphaerae bacterium]